MPSDNTGNILAVLTRRCPGRCVYCGMRRRGPAMSRARLHRVIDLLMGSGASRVELQLFGGEPLLVPSLVKEALTALGLAARRAGKRGRAVLTTGGHLLDPGMADLLVRHDARVLLSLDGDPAAQSSGRGRAPGGRDPYAAIGLLAGRAADFFVNMVVRPEEADRVAENAAFLRAAGARELQVSPALGRFWEPERMRALERGLVAATALARTRKGKGLRLMNLDNLAEPVLSSPQIVVDSDGEVSVGCGIVLETRLPRLARAFRVGPLSAVDGIGGLRRSRGAQLRLIRSRLRGTKEWGLVDNNLRLGTRLKRLMTRLRAVIGPGGRR